MKLPSNQFTYTAPPKPDLSRADSDLEAVAHTAITICDDLREYDPKELYACLVLACKTEPERIAQIIMTLAAWVDVTESPRVLGERVEAITRPKAS